MKAFIDLLNFLADMVSSMVEKYSEISIDPPRLSEFESAKCMTAE
jgi:hypothetical protein